MNKRIFKTRRIMFVFAVLAASSLASSAATVSTTEGPDVGSYIQKLGNPFAARYPENFIVRNPWVMEVFKSKIYLGHGDINLNTGPTDIWYLDPKSGTFVKEYTADDEAVEVFRECFGELCVPGADARESWDWGNFYRKEVDGWHKYRNLENGLHVSDLYTQKSQMFAAIWQYDLEEHPCTYGAVAISDGRGESWRIQRLPEWGAWTFFKLGGRLYVQTLPVRDSDPDYPPDCPDVRHSGLYRYSAGEFKPVFGVDLFPESHVEAPLPLIMPNAVQVQGTMVYLGSDWGTYDPFGVWAATSLSDARRIWLPEGAKARDIALVHKLLRSPTLYVLASLRRVNEIGEPEYTVLVYETQDLETLREVLHFTAPTFARSFEVFRGDFYFGMGGWGESVAEWDVVSEDGAWSEKGVRPEVGEIWKVSGKDLKKLPL